MLGQMRLSFPLFLGLVLVSATGAAANDSSLYGCRAAKEFLPLARLFSEVENTADSRVIYRQMKQVKRRACLGAFALNATIAYSTGATATLYAGRDGATWSWSNGQSLTLYAHRDGASWYWPNGQVITLYAYRLDASWYWPNGQTLTSYAGRKGASYYDQDGKMVLSSGPELKTSDGKLDLVPFLELIDSLAAETDEPQ
jgi:hypothetical protein